MKKPAVWQAGIKVAGMGGQGAAAAENKRIIVPLRIKQLFCAQITENLKIIVPGVIWIRTKIPIGISFYIKEKKECCDNCKWRDKNQKSFYQCIHPNQNWK